MPYPPTPPSSDWGRRDEQWANVRLRALDVVLRDRHHFIDVVADINRYTTSIARLRWRGLHLNDVGG